MPSSQPPLPRSTIAEYNHLRSRILTNAPILHGASPHVLHHGYAVITSRDTTPTGPLFRASLAAYIAPNPHGPTEAILLRTSRDCREVTHALNDLLGDMELELGERLMGVRIGGPIGGVSGEGFAGEKTPRALRRVRIAADGMQDTPMSSARALNDTGGGARVPNSVTMPLMARGDERGSKNSDGLGGRTVAENDTRDGIIAPLAYRPYRRPRTPDGVGHKAYKMFPGADGEGRG